MSIITGVPANADDFNVFSGILAHETITAGDALARRADGKVWKASAAALDSRLNFIGFALEDVAVGEPVSINIQRIANGSFTAGEDYYLSDTDGAISTAPGTYQRLVGAAISSTKLVRDYGVVSDIITLIGSDGSTSSQSYTTVFPCLVTAAQSGTQSSGYIEVGGFRVGVNDTDQGNSLLLPAHKNVDWSETAALIAQIVDYGSIR